MGEINDRDNSELVERVLKDEERLKRRAQLDGEPEDEVQLSGAVRFGDDELAFEEVVTSLPEIKPGDILVGTIVQVRQDGVMVDVGAKSEGFIPTNEWGEEMLSEAKVGEKVEVYVLRVEEERDEREGLIILSKRRADYERTWRRIVEAYEKGEILTAMVKERVRGGLVVDLGIDGFVPASQVYLGRRRRLENFVGRAIRVKIIELDRDRRRVICSNTIALEEERQRMKEETLKRIKVGEVLQGVVRRLRDYGAFIDVGGIEGLLHISEMSWTRIDHPSEVLKEGDVVEVVVLEFDPETERLSLGMRQLLPDPWNTAERDFPVGSRVKGKVTRIVPAGAFVRMPNGIEGIIPISEISERRITRAGDVLSVGQEVEVKVIQVNSAQRRLVLSLRQVIQEEERQQLRELMQQQEVPRVTLGEALKEVFDRVSPAKPSQGTSCGGSPSESEKM
ncbi:MAG: 30S ribosomal protein S1 [Armatimonadota bacterium]|nr:30S ribosomal protein S1 [Armatimonadota bacterium]MCX7777726.1 30S ribosomal protein S1 [Armatimonadota bacterium]MDW8025859.1 30S ribosomal protein S1 [Armatimonadota bacterium]